MADAVLPRWHGDNYQSRVFWDNALNLLDDEGTSCIVEVAFEADGPKAFDDVVVRYDPPHRQPRRRPRSPFRVPPQADQPKPPAWGRTIALPLVGRNAAVAKRDRPGLRSHREQPAAARAGRGADTEHFHRRLQH